MKRLSIVMIVMAIAALSAGPALAKGGHHSGGHHSGGHAHHSSGHAHASSSAHKGKTGRPAAKAPKASHAMKSQPKAANSHAKTTGSQPMAANSHAKTATSHAKTANSQPKTANSPTKTVPSQPNVQQHAKTATTTHHVSKTASAVHSGANAHVKANKSATATPSTTSARTTPRATHTTTVSHRGSYYHRGYGRRNYHRNRRNYARNGRPSFTAGPDQAVGANSGPQMVAPWATRIRGGSSRQMVGGLQFQVTNNSNPAIFRTPPSVSPTGTLSYTPAPGQAGTATVTLVLRSGNATSVPRTFHITIGPA
jgi:hypothetical protein